MSTGKRLKDVPVLHDELKTKRTIVLTPTAWNKIKLESAKENKSASEFIETWARTIDSE